VGEFPIEERAQQSGDACGLHEVLIVDGRGRAGLLAWQEASSLLARLARRNDKK
jgi:hypothetical protein